MNGRTKLAVALSIALLAALVAVDRAGAVTGPPIDNGEFRVSEHAIRSEALQVDPDVSGDLIVWRDNRGDSNEGSGNSLWFKDLSTRDEAPITTLATSLVPPRISGDRVVWHDGDEENLDLFTRVLPGGPETQLTSLPGLELNPAIDGNTIVYEDYNNEDGDIYMITLKNGKIGKPKAVVVADGDQTHPVVSGNRVAWRDGRRGQGFADVYVKNGRAGKKIAEAAGNAKSFGRSEVAIFGKRLLWNELDPACTGGDCSGPRLLKTCVLPCSGVPNLVDSVPSDDDSGQIVDIDFGGSRATWYRQTSSQGTGVRTKVFPFGDVESVAGAGGGTEGDPRVDGQTVVWSADDASGGFFGAKDVYWRRLTEFKAPRRANSIGLGPFALHTSVYADGDLVAYRGPQTDELPENPGAMPVWVTELEPERVYTQLGPTPLSTDGTRPAVVGDRVTWSDVGPADVLESDPFPAPGVDIASSCPGAPVDADGDLTAWHAGGSDTICVFDTSTDTLTPYDISGFKLDPDSVISRDVRISGTLVAWHEFFQPPDPDDPPEARLHVFDTSGPSDEIVAGGPGGTGGIGVVGSLADFDISAGVVVWANDQQLNQSRLWMNTFLGCACDHSAGAEIFEAPAGGHVLYSPSIDGSRVAWVDGVLDTQIDPFSDVYTRDLGEETKHLVTNDWDGEVATPMVDGDRVYWIGFLQLNQALGFGDVYVESTDDTDVIGGPDTTAPSNPTALVADPVSGGVDLDWTNPGDADFLKVRVLRKSGTTAPSGIDDTSATIVYEGPAESFFDDDVVPGLFYSYRIFAFDFEPNFSFGNSETTSGPV